MSDKLTYQKPEYSERLFQAITKQSGEGISLADIEGDYIFVNNAFCEMTGYSEKELLKMNVRDLVPPETEVSLFIRVTKKQSGIRETELMKKDGSRFYAEIKGYPIDLNDQLFVLGIVRDITERWQTDQLIKIQRDLSATLERTSRLDEALNECLNAALKVQGVDCGGIYLAQPDTGDLNLIVHRNLPMDFTATVSHLPRQSQQARIVVKRQPVFQTYTDMIDTMGLSDEQCKMRQLNGFRAMGVVPMAYQKDIIGCLNVASLTNNAFTEFARFSLEAIAAQMAGALARIKSNQALKESRDNFNALFESLDDFLFIINSTGHIIGFNPAVEQRLGYPAEELKGMHVSKVHPAERRIEATGIIQAMLVGQTNFCAVPLITRDGRLIPVETRVTKGIWDGETAIFGVSRDISRRLEAEEARRVSEDRLMAAIDAIDEGFVIYDAQDRLVMCNAKYLEIYKESADLIQPGARFEDIVQEGARRGQYSDAIEDAESWVTERLNRHRLCDQNLEQLLSNGRWLRIAERKMEDGSTVGFRVDITDLKRSEESARKALQDKEVLLREIHHRVKNNLAVIISLLNLQSMQNKDPNVCKSLMESQSRVRAMALIHETLYQSDDLSIVDFQGYVHKLIQNLLSLYGNPDDSILIDYDIHEIHLDISQAVASGLIINELVTNSLKYAFSNGKSGRILISAGTMNEDGVKLQVEDDGVGFPTDFDRDNFKTLGLRLVALMVEQLHGTWKIMAKEGGGVCVEIQWNKKQS